MSVGCSEIGISVIVKHVQHIRIIKAFCLPRGKFFSCWGDRKSNQLNAHVRLKRFLGDEERKVLIISFVLSDFNYCTLF